MQTMAKSAMMRVGSARWMRRTVAMLLPVLRVNGVRLLSRHLLPKLLPRLSRSLGAVIVLLLAIDLYRRPSSRPAERLPENGSVDDAVEQVLVGLTVREALTMLSPAHREVVEAVYGRGERAVEVAERLGIPAATVRTRSFHGLRALAAALETLGFEPT